ncbi:MAG: RNA polymerase sigma factor [Kofleriaceae bacterium]|nr:RNA polymerase sigma factor [Kofleriaceae bacterium]MBP6839002.1 RNA polymerase sigma factor [Kofleriaceae bacterium]MBP9208343.1 RNA polymerase sigma factor [Kofleriaceae bacterium]
MTAVAAYLDDVLLVDRCLTGEAHATRELFRRYRTRVYGSLYRVLGSNQDLDDLIQEAFLQVFQSLRGWRAEASLATWIDRVTVRVAYRYLSRRRGKGVPLEFDDERDGAAAQGDAATTAGGARHQLARDGVRQLYRVLDGLSPAARVAFTLHELEGRPVAEVADLVSASVTATKLRVWRARRAVEAAAAADPVLREFLADDRGGGS